MSLRPPARAGVEPLILGIAVVFGLQLFRAFASLATFVLYDVRRWSPLLLLVVMAAFLSSTLLARPLAARFGRRVAGLATAASLMVVRIYEQIVERPELDVWVAGLGCSFFWLLLALLRGGGEENGRHTARLLIVALIADGALLASLRTLDLSWQPPAAGLWIVLPAAAFGLAGAWSLRKGSVKDADAESVVDPPIALAAWLVLHLFAYQNLAAIAAHTGLGVEGACLLMSVASVLTLGSVFAIWPAFLAPARPWLGAGGVLVSVVLLPAGGAASAAAVLIGSAAAALALEAAFTDVSVGRRRSSISSLATPYLFLLLLFAYYATFRFGASLIRDSMPLVAALVLILGGGTRRPLRIDRQSVSQWPPKSLFIPLLAVLVLLPPVGLIGSRPSLVPGLSTGSPLRVATYNIHQGFSIRGRLDIEALAVDIETSGADLVSLQEVSRGWVVNGSLDALTWLQRRLGMQAVWAPTADGQWGNALLTRLPILSHRHYTLPPPSLPLRRGFVEVVVDLDGQPLRVLTTHLHHRSDGDDVRTEQVRVLTRHLRGAERTLLMGDLNALPDSMAISLLRAEGMVDALTTLAPVERATHFRNHGPRQIDYIWATPDLLLSEPLVLYTESSDHALVAVSVER